MILGHALRDGPPGSAKRSTSTAKPFGWTPRLVPARMSLGIALADAGRYDEAITEIARRYDSGPTMPPTSSSSPGRSSRRQGSRRP